MTPQEHIKELELSIKIKQDDAIAFLNTKLAQIEKLQLSLSHYKELINIQE